MAAISSYYRPDSGIGVYISPVAASLGNTSGPSPRGGRGDRQNATMQGVARRQSSKNYVGENLPHWMSVNL